jgi:crotonobetainyl-CoA:carnitine CoA-transferase CaiB-like acyl-CoA transferase
MTSWTVGYEKHDLQFRIQAIGVPVSAVQTPEDRIDFDTSTRDFNLWPTVEHSEIGEVAVDGNPVHFSDSDWNMNSGAPCLGEDNEKVFIEILGLSKEDIRGLKQENVI